MAAWKYKISLLVLKKYFPSEHSKQVKYFLKNEKRNFVSPRGHVISSMYVMLCCSVMKEEAFGFR